MAVQPTTQRHHTVVASMVMTLIADGHELAVGAELSFNSRDPFAVRVLFSIPNMPAVVWVFARDLLIDGLNGPSGHGDVQVFPTATGIVIELDSPGGRARLLADGESLTSFVQDTMDVVAAGAEDLFFDIDREIAMLAGYAAPGAASF
jgi:hypothetical protein